MSPERDPASDAQDPYDTPSGLLQRVEGSKEPDAILDRFVEWVRESGLEPYPAQQQALLELMSDHHVVLSTPTGSGKSLVALALHFKGLCEGRRSFYTAPTKALVNEKFFSLCDIFGARSVGMLTGDASINWGAPIICCTAEVLANMALRSGEAVDAPYVVADEFHYYGDRSRGVAWQIPLIALPRTTFLLLSATLGNTARIEERLRDFTGRPVAHVFSEDRPVPLDFEYAETPVRETVEGLLEAGKSPIYVVNFTQRECAAQAQGLTSARVLNRSERDQVAEQLAGFRFDSPYGRDIRRFLRNGIGIHHAGLLPKYRLLVEQLSQRGLLKVICGTDTLGVGVNIPIRTVLFTKLCKYDGEQVSILKVREFKQIGGRAGRKGFDDRGSVVCQAPEHLIEKRSAKTKAGQNRRRPPKPRRPPRGMIPWDAKTFERLIKRPPEPLESHFRVGHGMVVSVLQRDESAGEQGYRALAGLIDRCDEGHASRRRLRRQAAVVFRSLRNAGIVRLERQPGRRGSLVSIQEDLQQEFSLHQTLSLYLVEVLPALDPESPTYALDLLTAVESVLEDPRIILMQQVRVMKGKLLEQLKSRRVPYEERLSKLDAVSHPKPDAPFLYQTFLDFSEKHPWVGRENLRPKSIAREMYEGYESFHNFVRRYQLARSEGVLLRYLGQVYSTLVHSIPESASTDAVQDLIAFFRVMLGDVDSSLLHEWEGRVHPRVQTRVVVAPQAPTLSRAAFRARVRAEMHRLVAAIAVRDWEAASRCVAEVEGDAWDAPRFEAAFAPFFDEYAEVVFDPQARRADRTQIREEGPGCWRVQQVLCDPEGDDVWSIQAEIRQATIDADDGPWIEIQRIGI